MSNNIIMLNEVDGQDIKGTPEYKRPSTRMWKVICPECHKPWVVLLSSIKYGAVKSCGCNITDQSGDSNIASPFNPLYRQWINMKSRAKQRTIAGDICMVTDGWEKYSNYRYDAISGGWRPDNRLIVCRTGDVGNYSPHNTRFDSQQSNVEEALAKVYEFISPDGAYHKFTNLCKFSRLYGIDAPCMINVHSGKRKQHKGWTKYKE